MLALLAAARSSAATPPDRFAIANVTSDNASVSWTSAATEAGFVEFALSVSDLAARTGTFAEASDDGGLSRIHHVTLGEASEFDNRFSSGRQPLLPGRTYFFDVVSGGTRYDNQGAHFTLLTAARHDVQLARPEPVAFYLVDTSGLPVADAVMRYRLTASGQQSQQGSGLVRQGFARILDLSQLLSRDLSSPWAFSGTQSLVVTVSGPDLDQTTSAVLTLTADATVKRPSLPALPRHNAPPSASAGTDLAGVVGSVVTLSGSGTDVDGDPLEYLWTENAGSPAPVTLSSAARQATVTFTATAAGTYRFTLTVSDGRGAAATSAMAVVVSPAPAAGNDHASVPGATGPGDTLISQASPAAPGSLAGTIAQTAEQDWFRFYALPGYAYTLSSSGGTLANRRLALFSTDGATSLGDATASSGGSVTLPTFRPTISGNYFARMTASDGTSTGTYTVSARLSSELISAPPGVALALSASQAGYSAVLSTAGTTAPLVSLRVAMSFPGDSLAAGGLQTAPAAAGFQAGLTPLAPAMVSLDLTATTPTVLGPGTLASLTFQSRGGLVSSESLPALVSVQASTVASTVTRLRPNSDAGLPISLRSADLTNGQLTLDGRHSYDSDGAGRPLTYRWFQLDGRACTFDDPTAPRPKVTPPRAGFFRFGLVVSDGGIVSTTATVWVGVDAPAVAPALSISALLPGSSRVTDATTAVMAAVVGQAVVLDATNSTDPLGGNLSFSWSQLEGPPVSLSAAGRLFTFQPGSPGLYAFALTATGTDGAASLPSVVRFRVAAPGAAASPLTLTASSGGAQASDLGESPLLSVATPLYVPLGQTVQISALLDAAKIPTQQTYSFYWRQTRGLTVPFTQAGALESSSRLDSYIQFTPRTIGIFEFECRSLLAPAGELFSRKARVVTYEQSFAIPPAQSVLGGSLSSSGVLTGTTVSLSGSSPGRQPGSVAYQWVQAAGPPVILTGAATASASFRAPPVASERLFAFQLYTDSGLRSLPSLVTLVVVPSGSAGGSIALPPGVNLISVPVMPGGPHRYDVEDLARETGASLVIWTAADSTGKGRFVSWVRGQTGTPPAVDGSSGYLLVRPGRTSGNLGFSGTLWPASDRARSLLPGPNLLGYPAGIPEPQDSAAMERAAGSAFTVRWEPAATGLRNHPRIHVAAGAQTAFPLESGKGYLVNATQSELDLGRLAKSGGGPARVAKTASYTYRLLANWNLVGLALDTQPEPSTVSALAQMLSTGGAHLSRALRWTGTGFSEYTTAGTGVDFPVTPGEGYFVLNDGRPANVTLTGTDPGGATVTLAAGFNVISAPLASPLAAGDLIASVRGLGSDLTSVSELPGSLFSNYLPDAPDVSSPVNLARGGGVVVYATKPVTLRLGTPPGPAVTSARLPDGLLGAGYSFTLGASGTAPISWSVVSGSLPQGLALASNGILQGIPTAPGTSQVTLRATNADGTGDAPFTLSVYAPPSGLTRGAQTPDGLLQFVNPKDSSALVAVPAGTFVAGATTASVQALLSLSNELPLHNVTLGHFVLGKTEVTNAQYAAFLAATSDPYGPTLHKGHHPDEPLYKNHTPTGWNGAGVTTYSTSPSSPVVDIDWYDAYAYCAWAGLRLPTEAEFEYSARGNDRRTYPWGEDLWGANGLYRANGGQTSTCCGGDASDGYLYAAPVGSYGSTATSPRGDGSSPFGILDLLGNAWEWGLDYYAPYTANALTNPSGPVTGTQRVIKGGGFFSSLIYVRAVYRGYDTPSSRYASYGFRVARSVEPVIVTTELPAALASSAYSTTLSAQGTVASSWAVAAGALPAGLSLGASGVLSGTPVPAGDFPFLARATSPAGFAEAAFLLRVDPAGTSFVASNARGYRELRQQSDGSQLIEIPPATLPMGSTTASVAAGQALTNETPQHNVYSTRFLMGKYEITNAQYAAFLAATTDAAGPVRHEGHHPDEPAYKDHTPLGWTGAGSTPYSTAPNGPVAGIDWYDAWAYCAWAGLRLPTEAEWELVARGTDSRTYPWGSTAYGASGIYKANGGSATQCCTVDASDGFLYAAPVGSYGVTATAPRGDGTSVFGALDMAGNVWEWVIDRYAADYYLHSPSISPAGATLGYSRVLRGGGFVSSQDYLRAAYRGYDYPTSRLGSYGVRGARSFDPAILTTGLPAATVGTPYSFTLSTAGATAVTCAVSSGLLPTGFTLTQAGVLSGTPTTSAISRFTVRAGGQYGLDFRAFALHVDPAGTTFSGVNAKGYRELTNAKDGSALIEVPAGVFLMGSTTAAVQASYASTTEQPLHYVSLSHFYIGKTLVTNAQYAQFLAATSDPAGPTQHRGHHPGEGPNKDHTPASWTGTAVTLYSTSPNSPVVNVDWYDAYAYSVWAGLKLPTEAQYELAGRGPNSLAYPWGSEVPGTGGRYRANSGNLYTCCSADASDGDLYASVVGLYGPGAAPPRADGSSPFGGLDMVGNVWEWVGDYYDPAYYATFPYADPGGPSSGSYRILRGGSWYTSLFFERPTYRGYDVPTARYGSYGFRVAK